MQIKYDEPTPAGAQMEYDCREPEVPTQAGAQMKKRPSEETKIKTPATFQTQNKTQKQTGRRQKTERQDKTNKTKTNETTEQMWGGRWPSKRP